MNRKKARALPVLKSSHRQQMTGVFYINGANRHTLNPKISAPFFYSTGDKHLLRKFLEKLYSLLYILLGGALVFMMRSRDVSHRCELSFGVRSEARIDGDNPVQRENTHISS